MDPDPTFNVVVVYEDFATGKRAKKTYDYLVANLGQDCHFSNQMWKFEVLSIPKLREMAAKDATAADVIIISAHGDTELSADVKAWIETWLSDGTDAMALVALFDGGQDNPVVLENTKTYLAAVAARGNLEFFAQCEESAEKEEDLLLFPRSHAHGDKVLAIFPSSATNQLAFPRWGINE